MQPHEQSTIGCNAIKLHRVRHMRNRIRDTAIKKCLMCVYCGRSDCGKDIYGSTCGLRRSGGSGGLPGLGGDRGGTLLACPAPGFSSQVSAAAPRRGCVRAAEAVRQLASCVHRARAGLWLCSLCMARMLCCRLSCSIHMAIDIAFHIQDVSSQACFACVMKTVCKACSLCLNVLLGCRLPCMVSLQLGH